VYYESCLWLLKLPRELEVSTPFFQSSATESIEKSAHVRWGIQPEKVLIFDQAGNRI